MDHYDICEICGRDCQMEEMHTEWYSWWGIDAYCHECNETASKKQRAIALIRWGWRRFKIGAYSELYYGSLMAFKVLRS
jgi:hypothetical protein